MIDIDAIRRRVDAATPGPWQRSGVRTRIGDEDCIVITAADMAFAFVMIGSTYEDHGQSLHDAAFIAAARTDVPMLLDEIAALRAVIARVEGVRDEMFAAKLGTWAHAINAALAREPRI